MSTQMKAMVDKLLTGVSSAKPSHLMLCEQILAEVKSKQYSGKLGKYGNSHLRIVNSVIGGKGKYRRVEPIVTSTQSYNIEGHGLEGFVSEMDYANKEDPYDAEKDEVMGVTSLLHIEKEYLLASTLHNTALLTQNQTLSGASQFSDYNNSSPLDIFATARSTVRSGCGMRPDTVIMDEDVAEKLAFHPELLDYLGYKQSRPGGLSYEELAKALMVKRILVGQAQYNSAKEGQSDSMVNVWGKNIVFAVCPQKAETYQTSLGYMVRLESGSPREVTKQPSFNPPGTQILVVDKYDMLISNAGAGYLIKDAIA